MCNFFFFCLNLMGAKVHIRSQSANKNTRSLEFGRKWAPNMWPHHLQSMPFNLAFFIVRPWFYPKSPDRGGNFAKKERWIGQTN